MFGLLDYLKWRGDLDFDISSQNEIDALIFSEISYMPFEEIVPSINDGGFITLKEASDVFFAKHDEKEPLGAILPEEIKSLLKEAARTNRFSGVKLWGYVNEICLDTEKQFSAICCTCDNKITYVVYRGTDDTLVGWKEDLNMALFTPIPSQQAGVDYLQEISRITKDKLIVAGHSKGGNIAVYSALKANTKTQKKILNVYSFDGPGFQKDFAKAYQESEMLKKIKTILPSKSVVGRIFDVIGEHEIVKSSDKSIQQHNAFTWMVLGTSFETVEKFEKPSDNFHEILELWVSKMTFEQRHEFVEAFYKMASSSDVKTLTDITDKKFKYIMGVLKSDFSDKKILIEAIFKLIKEKNALNSAQKKAEKEEKKALKNDKKSKKIETKPAQ